LMSWTFMVLTSLIISGRVFLGLAGRLIDVSCVLISFLQDRFSDFAIVNLV
jgi:hypothetical protein